MTKTKFRADSITLRRSYTGEQREDAAIALSAQLNSYEPFLQAKTIAAYIPFGGEINILPSLCDLLTNSAYPERRLVLPRVQKPHGLEFHLCDSEVFCGKNSGGSFDEGYEGILEPPASWPIVPVKEIDLFLVPGVAFDKSCVRLGYGKGFYDRMLTHKRPDAQVVGIIFDDLLYEKLPAEDHDFIMDAVISPSYFFSAPSISA